VSADPLFASGAEDFGASAIGVVLSGANANGAAGVQTIRAAGGTAIAQDPREAAYGQMPLAALSAGVDYCGSARQIARYLNIVCQAKSR
jgi:two-component system chemotaxis response regulator CheB